MRFSAISSLVEILLRSPNIKAFVCHMFGYFIGRMQNLETICVCKHAEAVFPFVESDWGNRGSSLFDKFTIKFLIELKQTFQWKLKLEQL